MSTWVAALVAVAAITVTYFTCVRPMLRGQRHCGPATDQDPELSRQIAELRAEVRKLRTEDAEV
jgi:hypothetical protein